MLLCSFESNSKIACNECCPVQLVKQRVFNVVEFPDFSKLSQLSTVTLGQEPGHIFHSIVLVSKHVVQDAVYFFQTYSSGRPRFGAKYNKPRKMEKGGKNAAGETRRSVCLSYKNAENYYGFLKKVRTHRKRKATYTKKKRTHRKKKEPAGRKSY